MKVKVVAFLAARSLILLRGTSAMQSTSPKLPTIRGDRVLSRGPLFGRLTKAGKEHLLRHGWEMTTNDDEHNSSPARRRRRMAFAWPTKSGPQFTTIDAGAAHVRPLPREWTDAFDDKLELAQALEGSAISPAWIQSPPDADAINSDRLYFVKHRYGAQGKSVYVYNEEELLAWSSRSRNAQDFVIQEEVMPSLYEGRKYVLRCHILLILQDNAPIRSLVHRTSTICQHHSTVYRKGSVERSAQVSQAGKLHPPPILLHDLPIDHPVAGAYDKIRNCCHDLVRCVLEKKGLGSTPIAPETTCFALLGSDLLIDQRGNAKVCEVNSHPALGWGTMAKVPSGVFATLVEETLALVLLGGNERDTGFDPLF